MTTNNSETAALNKALDKERVVRELTLARKEVEALTIKLKTAKDAANKTQSKLPRPAAEKS